MKKLMCVFILIISVAANAAVIDSFKCEASLEDLLTKEKATSTNSFDVLRKSILNGPFEADIYTAGKADFDLTIIAKNHQVSATLQIDYEHAVRIENGVADARQNDCTNIVTSYCDSKGGCMQAAFICMKNNPFDPFMGWTKIPFIDGTPVFENRLMRTFNGDIKNDRGVVIAKYSSTCTHTGTSVE